MTSRSGTKALAAVVVALPVLTACGVDTKDADRDADARAANARQEQALARRQVAERQVRLPARPSGVVGVDGDTQGSLTSDAAQALARTGAAVRVNISNSGSNVAFPELCKGTIDAVDSARPMTAREFALCRRNGVRPVQFQVAADATVLATRNERDVGLDCLSLSQVREIYRSGSNITNWSQVGGYDIPLRTSGPNRSGNAFSFFSRYALGSQLPSLSAFRSSYQGLPTDRQVRETIVGQPEDVRDARFGEKADRDLRALRNAIVEKRVQIRTAERNVAKGRRDRRPADVRARDANQLRTARRQLRQLQRSLGPAEAFQRKTRRARDKVNRGIGQVGIFRFSYYELFEEQLRPIEIDASAPGTRKNCIFPSQDTVTRGTFPLARQLLITTTLKGLQRNEVKTFLRTYLNQARSLAAAQQLVQIDQQTIDTQLDWVSGRTPPRVIYYPPARARTTEQRSTTTTTGATPPTTR